MFAGLAGPAGIDRTLLSPALFSQVHALTREHLKIRVHEIVKITFQYPRGIAGFMLGAVIFDQRIGLQPVGANLIAEGDVGFDAADCAIASSCC